MSRGIRLEEEQSMYLCFEWGQVESFEGHSKKRRQRRGAGFDGGP